VRIKSNIVIMTLFVAASRRESILSSNVYLSCRFFVFILKFFTWIEKQCQKLHTCQLQDPWKYRSYFSFRSVLYMDPGETRVGNREVHVQFGLPVHTRVARKWVPRRWPRSWPRHESAVLRQYCGGQMRMTKQHDKLTKLYSTCSAVLHFY